MHKEGVVCIAAPTIFNWFFHKKQQKMVLL